MTWADGSVGITGTINARNSLVGRSFGEQIGSAGVAALSNGNYVVSSPLWNGLSGAATWGDGSVGITGTINASNSLVGSNFGDLVADGGVTALVNGNYVVNSLDWHGLGALTWGDGSVGTTGTVNSSNSLIG